MKKKEKNKMQKKQIIFSALLTECNWKQIFFGVV